VSIKVNWINGGNINFEIPETFQNGNTTYTVTEIAENGFQYKSNIKGITIPETITKIGNNAFQGSGITSVTIPNSVTEIGASAFQNCNSLLEVNVGSGVTSIGNNAFANSNIEEIHFEESDNTVAMGTHVFHSCNKLDYIALPKMNSIPERFFENCSDLDEIIVPAGVTSIGVCAFAQTHDCEIIFLGCGGDGGVITIASDAFQNCERDHFEFICLNNVVVLRVDNSTFSAFGNGAQMHVPCGLVTEYADAYPSNITIEAAKCVSITRASGHFCLPETWEGFEGDWEGKDDYMEIFNNSANLAPPELYAAKEYWLKKGNDDPGDDRYPNFVPRKPDHPFIIKEGHTVTLNHKRHIYPFNSINNGVLVVNAAEGGELIEEDLAGSGNVTDQNGVSHEEYYCLHENLGGEIEIVVPIKGNAWNFVGAPFNGYNLYALKLGPAVNGQLTDATVVEFNYGEGGNDWSMNYSYADDEIGAGEGFLVWPFYNDSIVFSTVEDRRSVEPPQEDNNSESPGLKIMESNFRLNNDDVVVTKTVTGTDVRGRWLALSNPYPAKICLYDFLTENPNAGIQGGGIYVHNAENNSFTPQFSNYDIAVGQGFFVNFTTDGDKTIGFRKNFLHEYNEPTHTSPSSAKAVEKEFIRFAMIEGERESEVLFAHNQDAQEGYDIFDANKLFAMSHIAEPYFVVDGISLVKEEVNLLPYYATMNVKSFGNKEVKFSPKYIPEGLSVTLIDGEESIDLLQGQEYATEISAGENANRFKLLIKKSLGLSDAEELEVNISNDNRIVNIATSETDLQIEVYNALGQKVFETKALNFSLNNVSAGAYMIKAFNSKGSKTQKIVVK
jgi:hypothetical protein